MNRDRYNYRDGGRGDYGMERNEFDKMRNQRSGGMMPHNDFDFDRQGSYGSGILGEAPNADRRPRGMGPGLMKEPHGLLGPGNDSLTAGLQEQILNHKRLEQKLNLRESQLALASNLLQQQNHMLDANMSGAGLMGPAPSNIPSLLDNSGPRHPPKRLTEGMRGGMMEPKRGRFDDRPPGPIDRRGDQRARSGDRSGTRRKDVYDPEFPTGERGFTQHLNSRQHGDRVRGVTDVARRNQAQQHLRSIEGGDFCGICDEPLKIPFEHHKRTTIHKKRVVQVNMGCGWCDYREFTNFREVLKHRATKKHIENEKRIKGNETRNTPSRGSRDRRDSNRDSTRKKNKDGDFIGGEKASSRDKDKKHVRSKSNGMSSSKSSSDKKKFEKDDPNVFNVKDLTEAENLVFDATKGVGQNLVIPVTGFFCKLCHKFYNNEEAAKVGHCKTQVHFDKYKVTMIAKFKKKAEIEAKAKEEEEAKTKDLIEAKEAEEMAAAEDEVKKDMDKADIKNEDDGDEIMEMESKDTSLETPEDINLSSAEPVHITDEDTEVANESDVNIVALDNETEENKILEKDSDQGSNSEEIEDDDDDDVDIGYGDDAVDDYDIGKQEEMDLLQNEVEKKAENVEMVEEKTEVEEEKEVEKEDTSIEETPTSKSPRSRGRTGKTRGGKAKRGRK